MYKIAFSLQECRQNMQVLKFLQTMLKESRKFYSELFDWNVEKSTGTESMPEGMEYWMVNTTDDKGRERLIGGGLMKRQNPQQQGIMNYIDVRNQRWIEYLLKG